ncbi:hypothetical protein [Mycobacterium sp. HUMS_1102779]|uniref:hypothetical protein n=1 Tax=Mycobacterium sp. HUMS_1102779 TaxID=3383487 RepID=UPI003899D070
MGELDRRRFLAAVAATLGVAAVTATVWVEALSRVRVAHGRPKPTLVTDWGAKVDGKRRKDATISPGSLNVVSCSGYDFTAADVGKILIIGLGTGHTQHAGSTPNQPHITTIASISGNNAVLKTPAAQAVSAAFVAWGTDDGAAWLAALTDMTNSYDSQLIMPAGISICGQAISLAPKDNIELFSLRGASVGTSEIICTAPGGFLTLDVTGAPWGGMLSNFDFRELTLTSAVAGASHALSVTSTGVGSRHSRSYTAEHILCQGFDQDDGYWDKPIEAIGMYLALLNDVVINGLWTPTTDMLDTESIYLPTLAINLNNSFAPELSHLNISDCKRAVQMIASGSQGGFFNECSIADCREGIYFQTDGRQPQLTIRGGWLSCRDFNICLNTRALTIISDVALCGTPQVSWNPSSTLATALTTGSSPTVLTLASTAGFPQVGALKIGSEWFTYNNLATGMDGTALHNVVRSQFGTGDPGSDYEIGATVSAARADIVLINTTATRINNSLFTYEQRANRIGVLLHSGNIDCSVANSYADIRNDGILAAIGNDSSNTQILNNTCTPGTVAVLGGVAPH